MNDGNRNDDPHEKLRRKLKDMSVTATALDVDGERRDLLAEALKNLEAAYDAHRKHAPGGAKT